MFFILVIFNVYVNFFLFHQNQILENTLGPWPANMSLIEQKKLWVEENGTKTLTFQNINNRLRFRILKHSILLHKVVTNLFKAFPDKKWKSEYFVWIVCFWVNAMNVDTQILPNKELDWLVDVLEKESTYYFYLVLSVFKNFKGYI